MKDQEKLKLREIMKALDHIDNLRIERHYWEEAQIRSEKHWRTIIAKSKSKIRKEAAQENFNQETAIYTEKIFKIENEIAEIKEDLKKKGYIL